MEDTICIVKKISKSLCDPDRRSLRTLLKIYLNEIDRDSPTIDKEELQTGLYQALMQGTASDSIASVNAPIVHCNICRDPNCPEPNQKH